MPHAREIDVAVALPQEIGTCLSDACAEGLNIRVVLESSSAFVLTSAAKTQEWMQLMPLMLVSSSHWGLHEL